MNLLFNLSVHGSLVFLVVWVLDRGLASTMSAQGRRGWWMLVPAAFLLPVSLPVFSTAKSMPMVEKMSAWAPMGRADAMTEKAAQGIGLDGSQVWFWLWLGGAGIYLLAVMVQTRGALRRWSRERLCTDSALLDLLEDCKYEVGVTAPIGLVVSDSISAPAILGWLRPRILIPRELVSSLSRPQLRAVLFHELAHFRFLDVPLQWGFTLARALHWFNPFAHLACRAWADFREEAADEAAMTSMKESTGASYGEALLKAIRQTHVDAPPFGALAIGESIHHLKRRLVMINQYQSKSPRLVLAGTVLAFVLVGLMVRPIRADDAPDTKTAAVAAMQAWLKEIDQSQYGQSWKDASAMFQKAVTSDQWTAACNSVRVPLGKCTDRKLASALEQTEVPSPTGPIKGDFVVAQFNSSFENLAYAVETVCFEKAPDGTWKASGYYVKPKS